MALEFNKNHNLAAILHCNHPSAADYQEGMGFFRNSLLRYALFTSPTLYADHLQQFWQNAVIQENDEGYEIIASRVNNEDIIINEASIRDDLHLHDEHGVLVQERNFVEETFRLMGYEHDFPRGAFKKGHLGANWRFIMHIFIHCLSSRRGGLDELDEIMGTAMALTCVGQVFNFSYNIFESMKRNVIDENKKFLLFPRFVQIMINAQLPHLQQGGSILEQKLMTHSLFLSLNKIYSNCKHSRAFTPYFQHMRDVAALPNPIPSPPREDLPLVGNLTDEEEHDVDDSESEQVENEQDIEEEVEENVQDVGDLGGHVQAQGDIVHESRTVPDPVTYSRKRKVKTLFMLKCETQEAEIQVLRSQEENLHLQINKQIKLLKKQKKLISKFQEASLFWKQKAKRLRRKYLNLKAQRTASNLGGSDDQPLDDVDETHVVPLDEIQIDDKLHFIEELIEIMDREVKQLKHSRIPIVKVRWNSKRGHEYTWEREDQIRLKYPHLFSDTLPTDNTN